MELNEIYGSMFTRQASSYI